LEKIKEIKINRALIVPGTETAGTVLDKCLVFVESLGWQFGGMTKDIASPESNPADF
jgi:hypothetical protein